MANVLGRPTAPLVLSAQERAYLEGQVRRRRVEAEKMIAELHPVLTGRVA